MPTLVNCSIAAPGGCRWHWGGPAKKGLRLDVFSLLKLQHPFIDIHWTNGAHPFLHVSSKNRWFFAEKHVFLWPRSWLPAGAPTRPSRSSPGSAVRRAAHWTPAARDANGSSPLVPSLRFQAKPFGIHLRTPRTFDVAWKLIAYCQTCPSFGCFAKVAFLILFVGECQEKLPFPNLLWFDIKHWHVRNASKTKLIAMQKNSILHTAYSRKSRCE